MADNKRLLEDNELEEIDGGKIILSVDGSSPNVSGIIAKLRSNNFDAEAIISNLNSFSLNELVALAKLYIPEELSAGLIAKMDKNTIFTKLAQAIRSRSK